MDEREREREREMVFSSTRCLMCINTNVLLLVVRSYELQILVRISGSSLSLSLSFSFGVFYLMWYLIGLWHYLLRGVKQSVGSHLIQKIFTIKWGSKHSELLINSNSQSDCSENTNWRGSITVWQTCLAGLSFAQSSKIVVHSTEAKQLISNKINRR